MTVNARARARMAELREQLRTVTEPDEIARIDRELSTAEAKALLSSDDEHLAELVEWVHIVTGSDGVRFDDAARIAFGRVRILSIDDLRDQLVELADRSDLGYTELISRIADETRQNRLQA